MKIKSENICYVYGNTLLLLKMFITDEDETDNLLELAGYDPNEEARVAAYFAELNVNDEEEEMEMVTSFVDIEKVKKGIRTLTTDELELFSLWILNYSNSEIAKSLCINHETVALLKRRTSRKIGRYYNVKGVSSLGARIVKVNSYYPLDDFIEERLRQVTGTDTAFNRLPEMDRNVLKYWKISDQQSITASFLGLSCDQVDKCRIRLFKSFREIVGANSMEDFILKIREKEELSRKKISPEDEAAILEQIDFNEVIVGLRSLARREMEVFEACKQGLSDSDIARRLSMDRRTVHLYKSNIFRKIGIMFLSADKPTLFRRIFQTREKVDQKLREAWNHAIDWDFLGRMITDREWSILNLWQQGESQRSIASKFAIDYRTVIATQEKIVKKTKHYHGVEYREEFEWLFDRNAFNKNANLRLNNSLNAN